MDTPNNVLWHATALAEIIKYKGHLPYEETLPKALLGSLYSYVKSDKNQQKIMEVTNKLLVLYLKRWTIPYRENLAGSTPNEMRQSVLAMVITKMQNSINNMSDREVDSVLKALMIPKIDLKREEFVKFVNSTESKAFSVILDVTNEIRDAEKNGLNG